MRILVSTNPSQYRRFDELITAYRDARQQEEGASLGHVSVLENQAHAFGPLEALHEALQHTATSDCLLTLGDMNFRENPFLPFAGVTGAEADWMGVADTVDPRELREGGLTICQGDTIIDVQERPGSPPEGAARWTGIARFRWDVGRDLQQFLARAPAGSPEGDLFAHRIARGHPVRAVRGPDFVNINEPRHLLLATLYAAAESGDLPPDVCGPLRQAAVHLRHSLLAEPTAPSAERAAS